jgi:surface carbohydrate biosynthesis protein
MTDKAGERRTLYVFVEVGSRELLSRMVVAEEARRRGYRVVVGEKNLLRNLCWMFGTPPGILLDKCGQMSRTHPILALKRRGFRYVVLDEEGLFFAHRNRLPDADDLVLFNSPYQHRLSELGPADGDIVGNPRLRPQGLLPYLQEEINEITSRYGKFVLICSSFDPKMKSSYGFPEEARIDEQFREQFLQLIRRLAGKVPIVYRPHPSDGEEFAAQVSQLVPVERRFTILPWIAATSLVVNAKCTSSFEALQLGVPSATLSLKSISHAKLNALSRRFYDVDSLGRYIESGDYNITLPQYKKRYVSMVAGPEEPERRLVDRLDALDVPATRRFNFLLAAAGLTKLANRVTYGRSVSSYIDIKYGRHSYARGFSGFTTHLGGHLILSRE